MKVDLKPLVRFMEHLPKNGDVELGLLKCHLLVEEVLTKVVTRAARSPEHILKGRFTFAQKISLARGLGDIPDNDWVWAALKKLNEARNELSHGLSVEQITSKLETFISYIESSQGIPPSDVISPPFGRFQWAAFIVFTHVSAYAHFDPTELKIPTVLESGRL